MEFKNIEKISYKQKLNCIKMFIFDIDGVLTNGTVLVQNDGSLLRKMAVKDGYMMKMALEKGYKIAIISGGKNKGVQKRLENLGIKDIFLGIQNKIDIYESLLETYHFEPKEILYMGDDIPDAACLQKSGVACCPSDACPEIKNISDYISNFKGGEGCVRDVIYQTLKVQEVL